MIILKVSIIFKDKTTLDAYVESIERVWISDGFFYINYSENDTLAKSTSSIEEFRLTTVR